MTTKTTYLKRVIAGILLLSSTFSYAQNVGINASGTAPDASAMLDVNATNKGFLMPRVALTGTTDATTIASPATSLLVYNTATAGGVTPGYYYNSGTPAVPVWTAFSSPSSPSKFTVTFGGSNFTIDTSPSPEGGFTLGRSTNQNYNDPATNAPSGKNYITQSIFCANSNCTFNGMNGYYLSGSGNQAITISLYRYHQTPGNASVMGTLVGTTAVASAPAGTFCAFSIPTPATPFTAQAGDLFLLYFNTASGSNTAAFMYGSMEFINN